MTNANITGSLTLDERSQRQLAAFLLHYGPEIISPATETEAGPMWLATIRDSRVAVVTVTAKALTPPAGVLTVGLAAELFPEAQRVAILHIRPTFSRLVLIDRRDLLLREYEKLKSG